jgi:hypothetical protein
MWHGLDLAHLENAQIGLPAVKLKQRIVVAADLLRQCGRTRNHLIEHAAQAGPSTEPG